LWRESGFRFWWPDLCLFLLLLMKSTQYGIFLGLILINQYVDEVGYCIRKNAASCITEHTLCQILHLWKETPCFAYANGKSVKYCSLLQAFQSAARGRSGRYQDSPRPRASFCQVSATLLPVLCIEVQLFRTGIVIILQNSV
jgi:hypothetical protein